VSPERRERLERHTLQPLASLAVFAGVVSFGAHLITSVVEGVVR
jgi:hypothetical protein